MMNDEERELFQREMLNVQPLEIVNRVVHNERKTSREYLTPGQRYRRETAQRSAAFDANTLPTEFVEHVRPEAIVSFRREGLQHGVFHRLKQGAYEIEAVLDLHGFTLEQARHEVYGFIQDCLSHDIRLGLISHGKGRGNRDQIPLLKSFLVRWLPLFPEIMAFHSAQKWHGGTGAVYVLLRKTERAKQRTRERLGLISVKPEM